MLRCIWVAGAGGVACLFVDWLQRLQPTRALPNTRPPCAAAFAVSPTFTSAISNITFYYNSTADSYDNAEAGCKTGGGHLATYTSIVSKRPTCTRLE
jgi:hypothetical protein